MSSAFWFIALVTGLAPIWIILFIWIADKCLASFIWTFSMLGAAANDPFVSVLREPDHPSEKTDRSLKEMPWIS